MRQGVRLNEVIPIYLKIILISLILLSLSAALAAEPVSLGHGKRGQIVNLERGAAGSAAVMPFMGSGFVAPAAPQPMEIDPGALVHQSQRLRDDSAALFQETYRLLNQTNALVERAEEAERGANAWADEARQSANLSFGHSQDARLVYDKAQSSLRRLDLLTRMLIYAEMVSRLQAASPNDSIAAEALLKEITDLERRISLLEERIDLLEKEYGNGSRTLP